MIFDLVKEFADVLDSMPKEHPRHRILKLLDEAIHRDVHFIDRHPTTFFQCMWNTCWWYDCPEAARHYVEPESGWEQSPPWVGGGQKLCQLLEMWRVTKVRDGLQIPWFRCLRPPPVHLGNGLLAVMRGHHMNTVHCVAYSQTGDRIASGASDLLSLRIWDAQNGVELLSIQAGLDLKHVVFSPDGQRIVTAAERSLESRLCLWDSRTGTLLLRIGEDLPVITALAYAPGNDRILAGAEDGTLRIWNAATGQELACWNGHVQRVLGVTFTSDGRYVISGSIDGFVRTWDADYGTAVSEFRVCDSLQCMSFASNGRRIATEAWPGGVLRIWDTESGTELACLTSDEARAAMNYIAWTPDGLRIARDFIGVDCGVVELDVLTGNVVRVLVDGSGQKLGGLAYSPDGRRLACGSWDDAVRVWDTAGRAESRLLRGHRCGPLREVLSSDRKCLLTGSPDGTIRLWSVSTATERLCISLPDGESEHASFLSFEHRMKWIISAGRTIRVWNARNGRALLCLEGHEMHVKHVDVASSGRRIVSASEDQTVRVWNARKGVQLHCFRGHRNVVIRVAISPDGRRVASTSSDKMLCIWPIDGDGEPLWLSGLEDTAKDLVFSTDGRRVIAQEGAWPATSKIRVWDLNTGRLTSLPSTAAEAELLKQGMLRPLLGVQEDLEFDCRVLNDPWMFLRWHDTRQILGWFPLSNSFEDRRIHSRLWIGRERLSGYLWWLQLEGIAERRTPKQESSWWARMLSLCKRLAVLLESPRTDRAINLVTNQVF